MPRPPTTATFLSKLVLPVIGFVLMVTGFVIEAIADNPEAPQTVGGMSLRSIGSWVLLIGTSWLILSVAAWAFAPSAWDTVAPYIVAVILALGILANIILDTAFRIAGIGSIINPDEGRPWRIALTIGVVAISLTQWLVSMQLSGREDIPRSSVIRLRLSSTAVLVLGTIAAWTSPLVIVGFLTLAAMIYIAIELVPR